jgi:hypothetical protein
VSVAPGRLSQGPDDVQPPHGERPCDGNRLKGVSQEISLTGIELTPLAGAYDLVGFNNRGGPVQALAKRVAHEGTRRRVVATHARVDVSDELGPWGMRMHRCKTLDAARLYSSPSMMVNDLAILAMRLASDRSGGSFPRSIQLRYLARQSSTLRVGSVSIASASSAP